MARSLVGDAHIGLHDLERIDALRAGRRAEHDIVGLAEGVVLGDRLPVGPLEGFPVGAPPGLLLDQLVGHEHLGSRDAQVRQQGGQRLVGGLDGAHALVEHGRAHGAVAEVLVRHGRPHERERLVRRLRVQGGGHALGEHHAVALHVEQLGEDVVGAIEQDVGLALVVVAPAQLHARDEGALGAAVGRPRDGHHLVGVVVLDLHAGVGVHHAVVAHVVHADGPGPGAQCRRRAS